MESQGYKIIRTDAAEGFVELMRKQGHDARLLDALTDDFGTELAMIFANAVLLHFNPEQVRQILEKVYDSVRPGGRFVFSVKQGEGDGMFREKIDAPRYFCYWQADDIRALLGATPFKLVEMSEASSRSATWFQIIVQK
jgi:SAM-dependent methyltransferase